MSDQEITAMKRISRNLLTLALLTRNQVVTDMTEGRHRTKILVDMTEGLHRTGILADMMEGRHRTEILADMTEGRHRTKILADMTEGRHRTTTRTKILATAIAMEDLLSRDIDSGE